MIALEGEQLFCAQLILYFPNFTLRLRFSYCFILYISSVTTRIIANNYNDGVSFVRRLIDRKCTTGVSTQASVRPQFLVYLISIVLKFDK